MKKVKLKFNRFKSFFPLFLIILVVFLTYNYSQIFIKYDFDGIYGKEVDLEAYNFKLKNGRGQKVELKDYRGEFVFITFGFTKCTGVCPLNLYRFQSLTKRISKEVGRVNFVFISFDHIRDSGKEIQDFISRFEVKNIQGLLGDLDTGLDVAKKYRNYIDLDVEKIKKNENFQIEHNGFLYLIDPTGKLKVIYMQKDLEEEKILADLKKIKTRKIK